MIRVGLTAWTFLALGLFSTLRAQEEATDPQRPSAIRVEGVSQVPAELLERLQQYENVRGAAFADWSPTGNGILIRTRFGNASQLHQVYEPGGRREQLTFFDEPVSGRFIPESETEDLLLSMSRGGDENYQIYLRDRGQFETELLTDGTSRNSMGPMADDGSRMVVTSNRRNSRDTDLYLLEPRKADSMKMIMETDGEYWYGADWSHDGETLLIGRYVSANEAYFALLDPETGDRTDLPLPGEEKAAISDMQFGPDGKYIYIATDAGSEFARLARFDLNSQKYEWLTDDIPWDVEDIEVDPETGRIAFSVNADGASELYLIEDGKRRQLELPLSIISGLQFSPEGDHLGLTLARPDAPVDAYSIELDSGELTRWTFSEIGGLNPERFVTPERIEVTSFDGREIPAYYYKPKKASAEDKAAVLILIHGGPEGQYRPYFSSNAQFYANELGLALLYPNVRGSAGYGKTYLKLDNAELREDSVKDIGALLDWIAEQPELDADRVAVSGGSYGGYMVLASLAHFPERIRAGIDIVGIANFITFLENTAAYRQDLRRAEYGDERDPKIRAFFERINPTANADKIRSALLVAHGVNDPRVPFSEAEQIAERVRARRIPVWTVYAENEGHGFAKKDNADYLRAVEVMFLKKYLELDDSE